MPFQFLPFTKLKNNFTELKDLLSPEENDAKVELIEQTIAQLISSNAGDLEKAKILTGIILASNLVVTEKIEQQPSNQWRIVDLDSDIKPRKVSQPIVNVDTALGVSKDNLLDDVSRFDALKAYQIHSQKTEKQRNSENNERRSIFASRIKAFGEPVEQKNTTNSFKM
jgi:hypothetical protein